MTTYNSNTKRDILRTLNAAQRIIGGRIDTYDGAPVLTLTEMGLSGQILENHLSSADAAKIANLDYEYPAGDPQDTGVCSGCVTWDRTPDKILASAYTAGLASETKKIKAHAGKSIVARRTRRIPQPLDWAENEARREESQASHADDANEHRNEES